MRKITTIAIFTGMTLFATGAMAADDAVKMRKEAMKEAKMNFKPLVGMVKGKVPFDLATVKKNAAQIAADLERARKLFPEGTGDGEAKVETRAKPEIWLMKDEFQAAFDNAIKRAKALAAIDSKAAFKPAVMGLGGDGCKACHKKFRLPKKKK